MSARPAVVAPERSRSRISKSTLAALALLAAPASAQTTADNLTKYWALRDRLTTDFLVVGADAGESVPAPERSEQQGYIKFADSTIVLGWYLGVLATEYAILTAPAAYPGANRGSATQLTQTLAELYYALNALERLDLVADSAFPPPCTQMQVLNGFFLRDDVPATMHTRVGGSLTSTQSDFIDPVLTNKEMSQDQIYHLLIGLALVKHLVPASVTVQGKALRAWAVQLAGLIGTHMSASGWTIKNPACSNRNVNRGEAAAGYSSGTRQALSFCTDGAVNPSTSSLWDAAWSLLRSPTAPVYSNVNNLHMAMAVAAVGNGWGPTTAQDLTTLGRPQDWVAYALVHRTLYGAGAAGYCQVDSEVSGRSRVMLDELPVGAEPLNPKPAGPAVHGWTTNHRFYRPKAEHYVGSGADGLRFSGLDYLLLHNLYALVDPSRWAGSACGSPCGDAGVCLGTGGGGGTGGAGGGSGGAGGGSGGAGGGSGGAGGGSGGAGGGSGGAGGGSGGAGGGSGGAGGGSGGTGGGSGGTGGGSGGTGGGSGGAGGGSSGTGGGSSGTGGGSGGGSSGGAGGGSSPAGGAPRGCGCTSFGGGAEWALVTLGALLRRRRDAGVRQGGQRNAQ